MKQSRGEEAEARRLRDEEVWEAVGPLCWEQGDPRGGVREPAPREGKEEPSRGFVGSGGTRGSSSEPCVWPQGKNFLTRGCLRASWWGSYLVVRSRSPLSLI